MDDIDKAVFGKINRAVSYLPPRIATQVAKICGDAGGADEIRICSSVPVVVTHDGKTYETAAVMTDEDMARTVRTVCGNSLYSHSETIREGYVVTSDGIRVGVCGRAVCDGGKIVSVTNFRSMVIRIPTRRIGFADELYDILSAESFAKNALVWSAPCGGKTTLLRELVHRMSSDKKVKTAVVDTRQEICDGLEGDALFTLSGFPRAKGIEIAVRTLSPDVIVCDEIWSREDREAIEYAAGCGASVVASCHALTYADAVRRSGGKNLFDIYYGVSKTGCGVVGAGDAS